MELENYLKQLLYQHDCVIVPGLGGFVCAHKKIEFNVQAGFIMPARKTVAFNQNLNNNDGLLANHLVQKEKIGFTKALENINAWVGRLNQILNEGETVNIDGLGSLSLNTEKKVVFVPFADVNFSTETYGLPKLDLGIKTKSKASAPQTAKKEKAQKQEEPLPIPPRPPVQPVRVKSRGRIIAGKIITIIIGLIVLAGLIIIQDYPFHSLAHKGSIINLDSTPAPKAKAAQTESYPLQNNSNTTAEPLVETTEPKQQEDNSLQNNTITQQRVETSTATSTKTDSVFYIIAGAFKSESNAEDLRDDLSRKGFSPEIINIPGSTLYRVGYNRYESRFEAESKLNDLRTKTRNNAAWVLAVKP